LTNTCLNMERGGYMTVDVDSGFGIVVEELYGLYDSGVQMDMVEDVKEEFSGDCIKGFVEVSQEKVFGAGVCWFCELSNSEMKNIMDRSMGYKTKLEWAYDLLDGVVEVEGDSFGEYFIVSVEEGNWSVVTDICPAAFFVYEGDKTGGHGVG
jgi:hypothetical protein